MQISDNKVVTVTYDLFVGDESEELMEQATAESPLVYCHGRGMMLPVFESNMSGKQAGDSFDFRISYADAYGEYDDEAVLQLDRSLFLDDNGQLDDRVRQFAIVPLNTSDGQVVQAQVIEIGKDKITVDLNHPLAGENLHFVGTIVDVRDATDDELRALKGGCCGGCKGNCNNDCESGCKGGCCDCE